ncbi:MAG: hypothetical protein PHO37_15100 [Kiritimatiellae bacterium]|nr:hypothetical protein [Kiritimatiellia bacterium]
MHKEQDERAMTNDCDAVIPFDPEMTGLATTNGRFQLDIFSERREQALCELRMLSGVPEIARTLKPNRVYRLVVPDGKVLQKGKDGLYRGVVYGADGKISQHTRFEQVPPSLARVASAVGTQIMLVSIAMQLNRVEEAIAAVSEELHNDRVAEILAGVQQFEMAAHMKDGNRRDMAIQHAIQSLTEGIVKVTLELHTRIRDLPESTNTFWDNWGGSKASRAASKLRLTEGAFKAAIQGASVLAECYAALDEPQAGTAAITRCLESIHATGIGTAADTARLVKVHDPLCLPELPWLRFDEARLDFSRNIQRTAVDAKALQKGRIAVDFQANELMEVP